MVHLSLILVSLDICALFNNFKKFGELVAIIFKLHFCVNLFYPFRLVFSLFYFIRRKNSISLIRWNWRMPGCEWFAMSSRYNIELTYPPSA